MPKRNRILAQRDVPLAFWRGKWRWNGKELAIPFECEYHETRNLRIETDGTVYMVDKSRP